MVTFRILGMRMECTFMHVVEGREPDAHFWVGRVLFERHCKTVGYVQDLALPAAKQHTDRPIVSCLLVPLRPVKVIHRAQQHQRVLQKRQRMQWEKGGGEGRKDRITLRERKEQGCKEEVLNSIAKSIRVRGQTWRAVLAFVTASCRCGNGS